MISAEELFNYNLPPERIAQRPVYPYHDAKLLVVERASGTLTDGVFFGISDLLSKSDLLIFNNSKVIPARLIGKHDNSGREVEILLVREQGDNLWVSMGRPLKKLAKGDLIRFDLGLNAEIGERLSNFEIEVKFFLDDNGQDVKEKIWQVGLMPIPPYIRDGRSDSEDKVDYQTIFAEHEGSIAAPTASLHFTETLLKKVKAVGCHLDYLTLHVGSASFLPLWNEGDREQGVRLPGSERYVCDNRLIERIYNHRKSGGRCIAVGTTVVRALESMAQNTIEQNETDLFISPGYNFKLVDALITNFHQPRSTHLALVEAFMGRKLLEQCYQFALENDYRFLSYGDGMFIM